MATTAPSHTLADPALPTSTRHISGSREPRVRSILLSGGNKPPGLHAPRVEDLGTNIDGPAHTPNATAYPQAQAPLVQVQAGIEVERRPPSIHLSEHLEVQDTTGVPQEEVSPTHDREDGSMPVPTPRTASRTRRMTLDLPSSPIDVLYESDHKLALEGTSPKPCIVPGNALHLIDDDPTAPRSATPTSVIIVGDESEHGVEAETDADYDGEEGGEGENRSQSQPPGVRPTQRVRFRSRVRITSGVHRHRHSTTGGSTPGSTTSDSPSSSISAPLRYQADENGAWGPIGKRLSAYATQGGLQRRPQVVQGQGGHVNGTRNGGARGRVKARGSRGYNERTPLLRPPPGQSTYSEDEDEETSGMNDEERVARAAALRREEEAVFGRWPWRIFNRHWWWWHVEPVLCCCCTDDDDYEEF